MIVPAAVPPKAHRIPPGFCRNWRISATARFRLVLPALSPSAAVAPRQYVRGPRASFGRWNSLRPPHEGDRRTSPAPQGLAPRARIVPLANSPRALEKTFILILRPYAEGLPAEHAQRMQHAPKRTPSREPFFPKLQVPSRSQRFQVALNDHTLPRLRSDDVSHSVEFATQICNLSSQFLYLRHASPHIAAQVASCLRKSSITFGLYRFSHLLQCGPSLFLPTRKNGAKPVLVENAAVGSFFQERRKGTTSSGEVWCIPARGAALCPLLSVTVAILHDEVKKPHVFVQNGMRCQQIG